MICIHFSLISYYVDKHRHHLAQAEEHRAAGVKDIAKIVAASAVSHSVVYGSGISLPHLCGTILLVSMTCVPHTQASKKNVSGTGEHWKQQANQP